MNTPVEEWNGVYESKTLENVRYDDWLLKHQQLIATTDQTPIINVGCGLGNTCRQLADAGYKVIACDYSPVAIAFINHHFKDLPTRVFDMSKGLPFPDKSAQVIVADLSIHYFSWKQTLAIVHDIKRVLFDGAYFLLRVNSVNDVNHGAGVGEEIEPHYFCNGTSYKRFFNNSQLDALFDDWTELYRKETTIDRFGLPKVAWEVVVSKKHA